MFKIDLNLLGGRGASSSMKNFTSWFPTDSDKEWIENNSIPIADFDEFYNKGKEYIAGDRQKYMDEIYNHQKQFVEKGSFQEMFLDTFYKKGQIDLPDEVEIELSTKEGKYVDSLERKYYENAAKNKGFKVTNKNQLKRIDLVDPNRWGSKTVYVEPKNYKKAKRIAAKYEAHKRYTQDLKLFDNNKDYTPKKAKAEVDGWWKGYYKKGSWR